MSEFLFDIVEDDVSLFPPARAFQDYAHEQLRIGAKAGHKNQMLYAPTGAGKTFLGLRIIKEARAKQRRAMFICDRTTLIDQTSATSDRYGMAHSVMQAQHWRYDADKPFQIASAQTLARRSIPETDVIIVDEAHTQMQVVSDLIMSTKALVIGLSATPCSIGLGKLYSRCVNATTMHDLTEAGVLVPMIPYTCTPTNMKGAATSGGEWTETAASERGMAIVGDVVIEWFEYAQDRKTIVFGSSIAHCEEICRAFSEANVMAALFTSRTSAPERAALLAEFTKPDSSLRVLISVEALAKGFDVPDVGCIVDCRPLRKSFSTAVQMWGRGLRCSPATGKTDCILLDHTGNITRFLDDLTNLYFNGMGRLDEGERLDKEIRRDEDEKEIQACPKCGFKPFGSRCMSCGHTRAVKATVVALPGHMEPVMIGKKKAADDQMHLWEQCCTYARGNAKEGKERGFAYFLFKDVAGTDPPRDWQNRFASIPDVPVTTTLLGKIRSRNIARAEAKKKVA